MLEEDFFRRRGHNRILCGVLGFISLTARDGELTHWEKFQIFVTQSGQRRVNVWCTKITVRIWTYIQNHKPEVCDRETLKSVLPLTLWSFFFFDQILKTMHQPGMTIIWYKIQETSIHRNYNVNYKEATLLPYTYSHNTFWHSP